VRQSCAELEQRVAALQSAKQELTQEVDRRQEAETELRQAQAELAGQLRNRTGELSQAQAVAAVEIQARQRAEEVATALTSHNITLSQELAESQQTEVTLRSRLAELADSDTQLQRQAESEARLAEHTRSLEEVREALEAEKTARKECEQQTAGLAATNSDLVRQLARHKEAESLLAQRCTNLEEQLKTATTHLRRAIIALTEETQCREKLEELARTLSEANAGLQHELARTQQAQKQLGDSQAALQAQLSEAQSQERAQRERLAETLRAARLEWHREQEASRLDLSRYRSALEIEVAERQRAEADLARARYSALVEMRSKAESLENLQGKVRLPLNSICAVASRFLEVEITDQQRVCVESLLARARELAGSLDDLGRCLDTKTDFETFVEQDLDLYHLAETLADELRAGAEGTKTDIVSIVHQDVPALLRGDPHRLREVLGHLLKHALAVTNKGEVVLQVQKDRELDTVAVLRFEVGDSGNSLSEELKKRSANLAEAQEQATAPPLGSNEIGLAIAKHLVEMMGGEFGITGTSPQGSVRWFTIPLAKPPAGAPSGSHARICLHDRRVLVAGDNQRRSRLLSAQLGAAGVRTGLAIDGVEAIALLRQEALAGRRFDAAVISQEMPDMNGLTLARIIRTDPALAPTRLVMLNCPHSPLPADQLGQAGFDGRLSRPIRQSDLEACLASLLNGPGTAG